MPKPKVDKDDRVFTIKIVVPGSLEDQKLEKLHSEIISELIPHVSDFGNDERTKFISYGWDRPLEF